MECKSHSSYGIPGLAPILNVLFWERRDFHVSFSVPQKFYGRYGDIIKHYEVSLSQTLHDIMGHGHI